MSSQLLPLEKEVRRKLEKILNGEFFYYDFFENPEKEGEFFLHIFTSKIKESEFWSKLKNAFGANINVVISTASERKFIKTFLLEKLKEEFPNIEYGKNIKELKGTGFGVYINWTNKGIVLHKYENGKFGSSLCKKLKSWETINGIWIVNLRDCKEAKEFSEKLRLEIGKHFDTLYSLNYHIACSAYNTCKEVKENES